MTDTKITLPESDIPTHIDCVDCLPDTAGSHMLLKTSDGCGFRLQAEVPEGRLPY